MKSLKYFFAAALLAAFGIALASEDAPPEHKKWMKELGDQNGAIRKNVDIEKNATGMAEILTEVGKWWRPRSSDIAMKSCKEARDGALALAKAAAANDTAGIAAGKKLIGAGCKGCHDNHREKISETEYKIK